MLAISRLSSSLHSSYCSSNSSPPSYPLIRTPSVSKPRYLLFTPKKVWWLLVLDVHPPLMYGKLWFVHLMVGLPSSDHPWQKKTIDKPFSHSNAHWWWISNWFPTDLMTRGTYLWLSAQPPVAATVAAPIRRVPGSQTALHRIARSESLRPRRVGSPLER